MNEVEQKLVDSGVRSALMVPLFSRGQPVGAFGLANHTPGAFGQAHAIAARQVSTLITPLIQNALLLQFERRRSERMNAVHRLAQELGSSLDVRGLFDRLTEVVKRVLDFHVMGVGLATSDGRSLERFALAGQRDASSTDRFEVMPLDRLSFAAGLTAGQSLLLGDTREELDARFPRDRKLLELSDRSVVCVPLFFGGRFGGMLHFAKQKPYWYDSWDVELAGEIAVHLVLAIQHQRLAVVESQARRVEARVETLRDELGGRYGFDRILGQSEALRATLDRAAKVAVTSTTVLLTGESGTGKELVARAIRHASPRADAPFIAINCAALPETLLESELFGHEKGAFTGADRQKPGRFELAAGGTLFLDEVGELASGVQAKLLRVLQEHEFQRVGGTSTIRADVRIIAASNRDLASLVEKGEFRQDLYYRLAVFTVHLPPLRDRGEDVLLLAEHFTSELECRMGKRVPGVSQEARDALLGYSWPGNIRELQNAIERAIILSLAALYTAQALRPGRHLDRRADRE